MIFKPFFPPPNTKRVIEIQSFETFGYNFFSMKEKKCNKWINAIADCTQGFI